MLPKLGRGKVKVDVFSGSQKLVAPVDVDDAEYDNENSDFDADDDCIDNAEYDDENADFDADDDCTTCI